MVGWHHRLNGHDFEQAPGDGEGQGSLVCCGPWGHKESDTTELLNNKNPHRHCVHMSILYVCPARKSICTSFLDSTHLH